MYLLGLAPIHVLQSLCPPLAREPEHPATLGVLGCRISIMFIIKYFCSVGFWFFLLSPSLTSHLSPSSDSFLVCSSRHDKHFSLLLPSRFTFCCLSSSLSLFLHFFFTVHSAVSQAMMDYPKLTPSLSRCQERGKTEGSALGLSNFFWAGRMTVSRNCRSRV